jgi:hypothetical protein
MKFVPRVPRILLTDARRKPIMELVMDEHGEPMLDDKGQPTKRQASLTQRELFVQRMDDPQLVHGKEPRAAAKFSNALYDAIEAQSEELVESRDGWVFEDEHAEAICRVVRKGPAPSPQNPMGGYNMNILHNLEQHFDAVENMKTWKEPVVEPKAMNGADARSLPEPAQA